jgi:hypothetical protein
MRFDAGAPDSFIIVFGAPVAAARQKSALISPVCASLPGRGRRAATPRSVKHMNILMFVLA